MENRLSTAKTRSMGIVVLPEFMDLGSFDFMEFVGGQKKPALARWRDPTAHREEGVWVIYTQCDIVARGEHIGIYLFAFPPSGPPNLTLRDLIFPIEIGGCLLIANRHFGYTIWDRIVKGPRKRSKDIQRSWLAWMQTQEMPFLIATIGEEPLALTIDQLRDYLDLEPQIPIWEIPSQFTAEHKYVYDLTEAKRVLVTLVEDIIANKPPSVRYG